MSARAPAVALLLGLVLAPSPLGAEAGSRWEWTGVPGIVAVGDVHGSYEQLVALLRGSGLLGEDLAWSGGRRHLVLCGDLIDRGPRDRAVLDLARRLQGEAEAAGGRVHVLLGNHEVMNMIRDFRYVSAESWAEFAGEETPKERQRNLRRYRARSPRPRDREREIEDAFAEEFPPGYFARRRAFSPRGEYGPWLLEQPAVVKVNGILFVHGGLTAEVAALGLEEINRRVVEDTRAFVEGAERLAGVADWPADYQAVMAAARRLAAGPRRGGSADFMAASAAELLRVREGLPFRPDGPLWYRGSAIENERLERERVARVLELLDARTEVVGHTVTRSGAVTARFNRLLYRTDVGMGYGRPARGLVIDERGFLGFDPATLAAAPPASEAPEGEGWPGGEEELPDEVLESYLARAAVVERSPLEIEGLALEVLEMQQGNMRLRALFGAASESVAAAAAAGRSARRRYEHQVAAYHLDRRLGLGLVPVTVLRSVGGRRGVLQIWMQSAVDLTFIITQDRWELLEGLEAEVARARAFSALIGTEERVDAGRMLLPVSRRILLADNGVAFSTVAEVAPFLPEGCGPVGPAFLNTLRSLERRTLLQDLEELVPEAAIDALLARRDGLLSLCEHPAEDWSIRGMLSRRRLPEAASSG